MIIISFVMFGVIKINIKVQNQKIEKLKDNPAIADLLKQKADIDEKIKIVEILIRDHNGTN